MKLTVGVLIGIGSVLAEEPLTNEAVLKMLNAGLSEDVVVSTINSNPGKFSLSPDQLIALKKAGVSDRVITGMLAIGQNGKAVEAGRPDAPSGAVVLHDGTPIRMRLSRNLSSADAKTGDTIDFEVLEEVKVDDALVISRGATALGTVTQAVKKKRMGRGGKLDVTIDYVRLANGEKAALRGVKETAGGGHTGAMTGAMVATALVAWPAAPFFLFMHGKDTTIPKGTEITAYINGEIKLNRAKLPASPGEGTVAGYSSR